MSRPIQELQIIVRNEKIKVHKMTKFNKYIDNNNKLKLQERYTLSLNSFLRRQHPDLDVVIESRFLSMFDDMDLKSIFGPRVDYIIKKARLIIEFDEEQHYRTQQQISLDAKRDKLTLVAGYYVLRLKYNNKWKEHFDILDDLLNQRKVIFKLSSYSSYIMNVFREDHAEEVVETLLKAITIEITNGVLEKDLGTTITDITFGKLINVLRLNHDEDMITEMKDNVEASGFEYEEDDEDFNNTLLSQQAIDYIIHMIPPTNVMSFQFAKLYGDIRNRLLYKFYHNLNYCVEEYDIRDENFGVCIEAIMEIKENEIFSCNKQLTKKNNKFVAYIEVATNYIRKKLFKLNPGQHRSNVKKQNVQGIILNEIPELRYSSNNEDEVSIDEITALLSVNAIGMKINMTQTQLMKKLKENDQIVIDTVENCVCNCKIVY